MALSLQWISIIVAVVAVGIGLILIFVVFKPTTTEDLDSTLDSARDLTGIWTGQATFRNRASDCVYQGKMTLTLQHTGSNLVGGYTLLVSSHDSDSGCVNVGSELPGAVNGTVSSSSVTMSSGPDVLKGSFTTDILTIYQDSVFDGSGPAVVLVGPVHLTQ